MARGSPFFQRKRDFGVENPPDYDILLISFGSGLAGPGRERRMEYASAV
jgi:hypothetical protein